MGQPVQACIWKTSIFLEVIIFGLFISIICATLHHLRCDVCRAVTAALPPSDAAGSKTYIFKPFPTPPKLTLPPLWCWWCGGNSSSSITSNTPNTYLPPSFLISTPATFTARTRENFKSYNNSFANFEFGCFIWIITVWTAAAEESRVRFN